MICGGLHDIILDIMATTPDIAGIEKFNYYRSKGLKYSEIAVLLKKKSYERTFNRWTNYLKTGKVKLDSKTE